MITLFNLALVALEVGAAIAYLDSNLWKSVYWSAAAVITVAVWKS